MGVPRRAAANAVVYFQIGPCNTVEKWGCHPNMGPPVPFWQFAKPMQKPTKLVCLTVISMRINFWLDISSFAKVMND
jgi:hypothetical protein